MALIGCCLASKDLLLYLLWGTYRLVSVFLPRVALLWHAAALTQEMSPVQEQDMLPKFQMHVMTQLTDELIKQGTESSWRG